MSAGADERRAVLAVTGLGMVTSLGHDATSACAAARAGLSGGALIDTLSVATDMRFGREDFDGPPWLFGHAVPGLAKGFAGAGKALELGAVALADLAASRPLSERELARAGLWLVVSEHFVHDSAAALEIPRPPDGDELPSAHWKRQAAGLAKSLARRARLTQLAESHVDHGGHAGFVACIDAAAAAIRSGNIDRAIVGGIESRVEPSFLLAAATLGLLKTRDHPVGLMPGEAASFVLLERRADADRHGAAYQATLGTTASARDPIHQLADRPAHGSVLADLVRRCLQAPSSPPRAADCFSICDLNGAERRAVDWGCALAKVHRAFHLDPVPWLPASAFGDTGAAAGPVAACLAVRAFARRYAPAPIALVCLSSESGAKGALTLAAAG